MQWLFVLDSWSPNKDLLQGWADENFLFFSTVEEDDDFLSLFKIKKTQQAVFVAESELSVICVENINDETFPASPGLCTHAAPVCWANSFINLWQWVWSSI